MLNRVLPDLDLLRLLVLWRVLSAALLGSDALLQGSWLPRVRHTHTHPCLLHLLLNRFLGEELLKSYLLEASLLRLVDHIPVRVGRRMGVQIFFIFFSLFIRVSIPLLALRSERLLFFLVVEL